METQASAVGSDVYAGEPKGAGEEEENIYKPILRKILQNLDFWNH